MSNMPDDDAARQQGNRQGTVGPDVPAQASPPQASPPQASPPQANAAQANAAQDDTIRQQAPGQAPGQEQYYAQTPYDQQPPYDRPTYGQAVVVPREETKVTGRRVMQYIVDYILAGIIPALAYWLFDRSNGNVHTAGWYVATIIALAAYFVYWVVIPYAHRGQTFGMQLFRIHVIRKTGGKASMGQLFVRGIFLVIDTLAFGLVGFITILCSKHRQRIGDHVAKTVVVPIRYGADL
jgi:uncharacterized RDD family membrane protein YckC